MYSDSHDPGMIYEGLVRYAFNDCNRRNDPKKIGDQSCYNSRFVPDVNQEGVEAIQYIIDGLVANRINNEDKKKELIELRKSVTRMKQSTGIELLQYIIKIIEE
jgi:hypothetical protein